MKSSTNLHMKPWQLFSFVNFPKVYAHKQTSMFQIALQSVLSNSHFNIFRYRVMFHKKDGKTKIMWVFFSHLKDLFFVIKNNLNLYAIALLYIQILQKYFEFF